MADEILNEATVKIEPIDCCGGTDETHTVESGNSVATFDVRHCSKVIELHYVGVKQPTIKDFRSRVPSSEHSIGRAAIMKHVINHAKKVGYPIYTEAMNNKINKWLHNKSVSGSGVKKLRDREYLIDPHKISEELEEGKHVTVNVTVKQPAKKAAANKKPAKKKEKPPEKAPDFRHQFAGAPAPGEAEPDFQKLDGKEDWKVRAQKYKAVGYHPENKKGSCKHVGIRVFNAHSYGMLNYCPKNGTMRVDGIKTRKSQEVSFSGQQKGGYSKYQNEVVKEVKRLAKQAGAKKITSKPRYGVEARKQYMHNGKAMMRQLGLSKFDKKSHSFFGSLEKAAKQPAKPKKNKKLNEAYEPNEWVHYPDDCGACNGSNNNDWHNGVCEKCDAKGSVHLSQTRDGNDDTLTCQSCMPTGKSSRQRDTSKSVKKDSGVIEDNNTLREFLESIDEATSQLYDGFKLGPCEGCKDYPVGTHLRQNVVSQQWHCMTCQSRESLNPRWPAHVDALKNKKAVNENWLWDKMADGSRYRGEHHTHDHEAHCVGQEEFFDNCEVCEKENHFSTGRPVNKATHQVLLKKGPQGWTGNRIHMCDDHVKVAKADSTETIKNDTGIIEAWPVLTNLPPVHDSCEQAGCAMASSQCGFVTKRNAEGKVSDHCRNPSKHLFMAAGGYPYTSACEEHFEARKAEAHKGREKHIKDTQALRDKHRLSLMGVIESRDGDDYDGPERRKSHRYEHSIPIHHEDETGGERAVRAVAKKTNTPIHHTEDCAFVNDRAYTKHIKVEPITHGGTHAGDLVRQTNNNRPVCTHLNEHPDPARTQRVTTKLEPCSCPRAKDRSKPHEHIVIRNKSFKAELTRCPNRHFTSVDYVSEQHRGNSGDHKRHLANLMRHIKHEVATRSNYTYTDAAHRATHSIFTQMGGKPNRRRTKNRIYVGRNQLKRFHLGPFKNDVIESGDPDHVWLHDHDFHCGDSFSNLDHCDYCDEYSEHDPQPTHHVERVSHNTFIPTGHHRTICDNCMSDWHHNGSAKFYDSGKNEPVSHTDGELRLHEPVEKPKPANTIKKDAGIIEAIQRGSPENCAYEDARDTLCVDGPIEPVRLPPLKGKDYFSTHNEEIHYVCPAHKGKARTYARNRKNIGRNAVSVKKDAGVIEAIESRTYGSPTECSWLGGDECGHRQGAEMHRVHVPQAFFPKHYLPEEHYYVCDHHKPKAMDLRAFRLESGGTTDTTHDVKRDSGVIESLNEAHAKKKVLNSVCMGSKSDEPHDHTKYEISSGPYKATASICAHTKHFRIHDLRNQGAMDLSRYSDKEVTQYGDTVPAKDPNNKPNHLMGVIAKIRQLAKSHGAVRMSSDFVNDKLKKTLQKRLDVVQESKLSPEFAQTDFSGYVPKRDTYLPDSPVDVYQNATHGKVTSKAVSEANRYMRTEFSEPRNEPIENLIATESCSLGTEECPPHVHQATVKKYMKKIYTGSVEPIHVTNRTPGKFHVIDGHHRLEAYKRMKKSHVKVVEQKFVDVNEAPVPVRTQNATGKAISEAAKRVFNVSIDKVIPTQECYHDDDEHDAVVEKKMRHIRSGIVQPLAVARHLEDDPDCDECSRNNGYCGDREKVLLHDGHHRLDGHKKLGHKTVPVYLGVGDNLKEALTHDHASCSGPFKECFGCDGKRPASHTVKGANSERHLCDPCMDYYAKTINRGNMAVALGQLQNQPQRTKPRRKLRMFNEAVTHREYKDGYSCIYRQEHCDKDVAHEFQSGPYTALTYHCPTTKKYYVADVNNDGPNSPNEPMHLHKLLKAIQTHAKAQGATVHAAVVNKKLKGLLQRRGAKVVYEARRSGEWSEYADNEVTRKKYPNAFKNKKHFDHKVGKAKVEKRDSFKGVANTDAESIKPGQLDKARKKFHKYKGHQFKSKEEANAHFDKMVSKAKAGKSEPSIVGVKGGKEHHLIAGNTRAMIHRAIGKPAPVKHVDLGESAHSGISGDKVRGLSWHHDHSTCAHRASDYCDLHTDHTDSHIHAKEPFHVVKLSPRDLVDFTVCDTCIKKMHTENMSGRQGMVRRDAGVIEDVTDFVRPPRKWEFHDHAQCSKPRLASVCVREPYTKVRMAHHDLPNTKTYERRKCTKQATHMVGDKPMCDSCADEHEQLGAMAYKNPNRKGGEVRQFRPKTVTEGKDFEVITDPKHHFLSGDGSNDSIGPRECHRCGAKATVAVRFMSLVRFSCTPCGAKSVSKSVSNASKASASSAIPKDAGVIEAYQFKGLSTHLRPQEPQTLTNGRKITSYGQCHFAKDRVMNDPEYCSNPASHVLDVDGIEHYRLCDDHAGEWHQALSKGMRNAIKKDVGVIEGFTYQDSETYLKPSNDIGLRPCHRKIRTDGRACSDNGKATHLFITGKEDSDTGSRYYDLCDKHAELLHKSLQGGRQIKAIKADAGVIESDDYRGFHKAPDPDSGSPMHNVADGMYPEDFYSHMGHHYYGDHRPDDKAAHRAIVDCRHKPHKKVKVYRSVPAHVNAEINPGDWVTHNKNYARDHGLRWDKHKILSKTVCAGELYTEGNSFHEWGYHPHDCGAEVKHDSGIIEDHDGGTKHPHEGQSFYMSGKHMPEQYHCGPQGIRKVDPSKAGVRYGSESLRWGRHGVGFYTTNDKTKARGYGSSLRWDKNVVTHHNSKAEPFKVLNVYKVHPSAHVLNVPHKFDSVWGERFPSHPAVKAIAKWAEKSGRDPLHYSDPDDQLDTIHSFAKEHGYHGVNFEARGASPHDQFDHEETVWHDHSKLIPVPHKVARRRGIKRHDESVNEDVTKFPGEYKWGHDHSKCGSVPNTKCGNKKCWDRATHDDGQGIPHCDKHQQNAESFDDFKSWGNKFVSDVKAGKTPEKIAGDNVVQNSRFVDHKPSNTKFAKDPVTGWRAGMETPAAAYTRRPPQKAPVRPKGTSPEPPSDNRPKAPVVPFKRKNESVNEGVQHDHSICKERARQLGDDEVPCANCGLKHPSMHLAYVSNLSSRRTMYCDPCFKSGTGDKSDRIKSDSGVIESSNHNHTCPDCGDEWEHAMNRGETCDSGDHCEDCEDVDITPEQQDHIKQIAAKVRSDYRSRQVKKDSGVIESTMYCKVYKCNRKASTTTSAGPACSGHLADVQAEAEVLNSRVKRKPRPITRRELIRMDAGIIEASNPAHNHSYCNKFEKLHASFAGCGHCFKWAQHVVQPDPYTYRFLCDDCVKKYPTPVAVDSGVIE